MDLSKEQILNIELSFHKVQAFEGAKIIDSNYSGSLIDGIEDALITVAQAYRYGAGATKNHDKAINHLRDAIKLGSGDAANELGRIFAHDDWWGKKSYRIDAEECFQTAINLWKKEVANGSSRAAWKIYNSTKGRSQKDAQKWASIAIELAKKSDDREELTFMEEAYKHDQTFQLKKFDLRRAEPAIKSLEFYFDFKKDHEDWYVGSHDREKDEEEMRLFQKVLLETINSINRSFNAEEKKEIERLRNLCQKEV